jgi:integrase
LKALHRYQEQLGIPAFRFHDLRHFFASYSHLQGMPEAAILSTGGWKSDHVMKSIYRHEMEQKQAQEDVFTKLFSEQ